MDVHGTAAIADILDTAGDPEYRAMQDQYVSSI